MLLNFCDETGIKSKAMVKSVSKLKKEVIPEIPWDDEPLTPEEERAIEQGRRAIREGKCVTLDQLEHDLERRRRRPRSKKS